MAVHVNDADILVTPGIREEIQITAEAPTSRPELKDLV